MIGIHAFSDMEVMSFMVERKATKVAFLFLMYSGYWLASQGIFWNTWMRKALKD
jgi:hypothetical protein